MRRRVPEPAASWVFDTGSLTARLSERCPGRFKVRVLFHGWALPGYGEARVLGLGRCRGALIREVHLYCGDTPVVFARTVIPAATARGRSRRVAHLRNRPLGAFLFADPTLEREALEVVDAPPGRDIRRRSAGSETRDARVWGRRSVFRLRGRSLLVAEVFLPALFDNPGGAR